MQLAPGSLQDPRGLSEVPVRALDGRQHDLRARPPGRYVGAMASSPRLSGLGHARVEDRNDDTAARCRVATFEMPPPHETRAAGPRIVITTMMLRMNSIGLLAVLLAVTGCSASSSRNTVAPVSRPIEPAAVAPQVPAVPAAALPPAAARPTMPGFAGATAWLNVDHPVTREELAGKVVVVDFWTSCCINCIQTLPTLAAIEKRFAGEAVAVVGVHSPKFDAETERERLRAAIEQYEIHHPVAIDGSMNVWNAWGVRGWPTLFVLDAHGRAVWSGSGEPDANQLASIVQGALDEGMREGSLNPHGLSGWRPEAITPLPLAYPGKAVALGSGETAIADTAHHRIVFSDAQGNVTDVVGSGLAGNLDGTYGEAAFRKPQGLAEAGLVVYVADTRNPRSRAIDQGTRTVSTVRSDHTARRSPAQIGRSVAPDERLDRRRPWPR